MDIKERLSQMRLFAALSSEDQERWGEWFETQPCHREDVILQQGEPATTFFIVDSGELRAFVTKGDKEEPVAIFYPGDYFGETGLLTGAPRNATVKAMADGVLFVLSKDRFEQLMAEFPDVREQLRAKSEQREAVGRMRFPWQEEDEVTVIFSTKHWIELLHAFRLTAVLGILGLAATLMYAQATVGALSQVILTISAGSLLAVTVLLGIYQFFDWRNDHFIVTNLRVLHVERVLLLREDRDEAPIGRVQDVQVQQRGVLANVLDFGNVIIQTAAATERIVFSNIPHPDEVYDAIFAPKQRERDQSRQRELVRKDLRQLLGLEKPPKDGADQPAEADQDQSTEETADTFDLAEALDSVWQWFREQFNFQTWIESDDGNTITWRKNGWLLVSVSIVPFLIAIGLVAASILAFSRGLGSLSLSTLLFVFMLVDFGYWFYVYWDWQNDIYQISGNRLIDLKRRPLFLEELRRETTLDNVQNVSLSIPGPIAQLLNYGTVIIETAGERGAFRFEHVKNPRGVQQEIFHRREKLYRDREEQAEQSQRAQMLMWFDEYDKAKQEQVTPSTRPERNAT